MYHLHIFAIHLTSVSMAIFQMNLGNQSSLSFLPPSVPEENLWGYVSQGFMGQIRHDMTYSVLKALLNPKQPTYGPDALPVSNQQCPKQ